MLGVDSKYCSRTAANRVYHNICGEWEANFATSAAPDRNFKLFRVRSPLAAFSRGMPYNAESPLHAALALN